jgi:hypothetical protein
MARKRKNKDIPVIDTASLEQTEALFRQKNLQETARRLIVPQEQSSPFSYNANKNQAVFLDTTRLDELQQQISQNAQKSFVIPEVQEQQFPPPRFVGDGIDALIAGTQDIINQKHNQTNKIITEQELPNDIKEREEKYGVQVFFTKSPSEIESLLSQRICNVEFIRSTFPKGKRVIRCTLNSEYIPGGKVGFGNYGGLVKVWDVELNDYRSFYASTVLKISYDDNPGQPS